MAPRGRTRKVGLTRMDAALDAMVPYGFSRELVRRTVKNLLEVYGGDEGWIFIEDGSYNLLIETILQRQEKSEEEKGATKDIPSHNEGQGGDDAIAFAAGPSSRVPELNSFHLEDVDTASQVDETGQSGLQLVEGEGRDRKGLDLDRNSGEKWPANIFERSDGNSVGGICGGNAPLQGNYGGETGGKNDCVLAQEGKCWEGHGLDKNSDEKQPVDTTTNKDKSSVGELFDRNNVPNPLVNVIHSPVLVDSVPGRRCRPCHGWISSDEEDDFTDLLTATLPGQLTGLINGTVGGERKSRWDMRPDKL